MRNSVVLIEEFISGITFELLITSFYGVIFIINFYVPIYSQIRFYVLYREIYSQRKYTLMDEHVKYLIVWHFFKASNVNVCFAFLCLLTGGTSPRTTFVAGPLIKTCFG